MSPALADRRAELVHARLRIDQLAPVRRPPVDLDAVEDLVVIASSSRGGSSVFTEILRSSPDLNHLPAESNPYLLLAGAGPLDSGRNSDALFPGDPHDGPRLWRDLGQEVGRRAPGGAGALDPDVWAADMAFRLAIQWPTLEIPLAAVRAALGPPTGDPVDCFLGVIARLRKDFPAINPWFYDLSPARIATTFPDLPAPEGPPGPLILEEPPFVLPLPWEVGLQPERPLVVKTPSNAYRLAWLRERFPKARFRLIHLVRNPAAAINGLVDGWTFRGFHAHALDGPLGIPGYADIRPADAHFWKYDLFPGWQAWTGSPIATVAAAQWAAAHSAILEFRATYPEVPVLQVHVEQAIGEQRVATFAAVAQFLGIPYEGPLQMAVEGEWPLVMSTAPPRARRWFTRAAAVEQALSVDRVLALSEVLGVADRSTWR